ncbi:Golgi reassembly-stacking protein 2 [Irineochytrium annulatum]|nr:Golgi reassembly-stacking protein 2 [Irineochytrium annulatum]
MGGNQSMMEDHGSSKGFHVLREEDNEVLPDIVEMSRSAGAEVHFAVWNVKTQRLREVTLLPSPTASLGLHVRFCDHAHARDAWHILSVHPSSPAERAGLHPDTDYILACADMTLTDRDSLLDLFESSLGKTVRLLVYSSVLDTELRGRRRGMGTITGSTMGMGTIMGSTMGMVMESTGMRITGYSTGDTIMEGTASIPGTITADTMATITEITKETITDGNPKTRRYWGRDRPLRLYRRLPRLALCRETDRS